MFDKYMIVEEGFKNIEESGEVIGFQMGVRLPYYRGVVLSLVGEMVITVDGEKMPYDQMTLTLDGENYPLTKLEDEPVAKWEFGNIGLITIAKPGGLAPGEHKVELRQHMKISYVPNGFWGQDEKTLRIPG
ncbi:MAG: hypothetical protein H6667_09625 [Ardenticatenaceae bacterium]|nr:hypothetical protein [Ardenticatenaceae bacterium]MCB9443447.1 hypothetical protein [Ardenticatenaceae bacterium]